MFIIIWEPILINTTGKDSVRSSQRTPRIHSWGQPLYCENSGLVIVSIKRKKLDNVCGQKADGGIYSHHFALDQRCKHLCGHKDQTKDIKVSAGHIINKTCIFYLQVTKWQHPVVSFTNIGAAERILK